MRNKFCSNRANPNKNSFNSQYEGTKDLYAIALEYEAKFLSLNYDLITPKLNDFSIRIARAFLRNMAVENFDSISNSTESVKNYAFGSSKSTAYDSFNRSFYNSSSESFYSSNKRSFDECDTTLRCESFKRSFSNDSNL